MKWAYSVLIPFQKLKEKIIQGFNLYDLADYFDVDIEYMINCIDFYTEKYGILVLYKRKKYKKRRDVIC